MLVKQSLCKKQISHSLPSLPPVLKTQISNALSTANLTLYKARNCNATVQCSECRSDKHPSALHPGKAPWLAKPSLSSELHDGEEEEISHTEVSPKCTEVCSVALKGKSCSKICLVKVYPDGHPSKYRRMYAMLDDQSNRSLVRSEFFDMFNIQGPTVPFTLKTCSGVTETAGRRAVGYTIEPVDGTLSLFLPTLLECNMIPGNKDEIPTPAVAAFHRHLRSIAHEMPSIDENAEILLLIGRDLLRVHKVHRQVTGPLDAAFAQKLDLGWVIIGDVCLGKAHWPQVTSMKTYILENGRPSNFPPCESYVSVKEKYTSPLHHLSLENSQYNLKDAYKEDIGQSVFCQSVNDNKLAPSVEDIKFLRTMEDEFFQDSTNSWVAPLPFRKPRQYLPNNRFYAMSRFKSLSRTLEKRPEMKAHFMEFMQKILDSHHAEIAPPVQEGKEYWYLPFFGVYHPQKHNQIRVVFDSSAKFDGVLLNDVLLTGPDINNSLLGVLLRFRKESVAITADIQQMFHCFLVREDCRDVLRFVWYKDNDPEKEVIDYRMRVHVFGNSPSPAVAIYGLRKVAQEGKDEFGTDVHHFVERDFYMDDALKSFPTVDEAIDILSRTQRMLAASNLKLHKVASNKAEVLEAFPVEDRAKDLQNLNLFVDDLPDQRSLGVKWSIMTDVLTFHIPKTERPYTRRGVLSIVNSLFDPLGFLAPITIQGRLLLREMMGQGSDWDSSLPESFKGRWMDWQNSLHNLADIRVPRTYSTMSLSEAQSVDLCVFSDASVKTISAVAYLRVESKDGLREVGFVLGKSRLAPSPDLTIPRLELCAAVMAVEIAEVISEEIEMEFNSISFYTDSKVVLGYIHNQSRRFNIYVNNRVQRIKQFTKPEQWHYVPSDENPADHGSRSVSASKLLSTTWLTGPPFLHGKQPQAPEEQISFELFQPDDDKEIRPEVNTLSTSVSENSLRSNRWERFSRWKSAVKAVARLSHIAYCFTHPTEVGECAANRNISRQSSLVKLNPIIGSDGLLRVGGRIHRAEFDVKEKNPVIIPGGEHISTLLIRHYHERVQHQGRHFTEGAVRAGGLWIVGGRRLISKVLYQCVTCRRLRGKVKEQQMSDLPAERLQIDPPFSYAGMDMFGPWEVSVRRTRGGHASSKRWAVLFTCLCTRAVHIEVVEEMSSSSFINALRRFFSLRGPAKQLRSDCGTNFIGACNEMGISVPGRDSVQEFLQDQKCTWIFNPPHSSHMGGVWERMIGVARRILDSMLLQAGRVRLTHEVLTTLMAEVTAIMNAQPLIPVSSDPENPYILTLSMLLTQKTDSHFSPLSDINEGNMFKSQWKRVQALAEEFWYRWRKEYLSTLQCRKKWPQKEFDIKEGDVVLLKENQAKRNEWPIGIIVKAVPSEDGMIRKAEVKVVKQGVTKIYYRPISELVFLMSPI
ncbi:hypothetical protein QQF64_009683 [Cirrhinus molitorella]|uniref:Integrase catalytic domain-containing protein n=1 Tax=Cirrhinus molitorella TaxID=172907 RepID=A0ABR3M4D5_9TELE